MYFKGYKDFLFDGYYDADLTFAIYQMYSESDEGAVPEELLRQTASLVAMVARKCLPFDLCQAEVESRMSDALSYMYFIYLKKRIPLANPMAFKAYLWKCCLREMIESGKVYAATEIDFGYGHNNEMYWPVDSVDRRIHAKEIRDLAFHLFRSDTRFKGAERRACLFMARCFLHFLDATPAIVTVKYGTIKRFKFLVDYTRSAVQASLYEAMKLANAEIEEISGA